MAVKEEDKLGESDGEEEEDEKQEERLKQPMGIDLRKTREISRV